MVVIPQVSPAAAPASGKSPTAGRAAPTTAPTGIAAGSQAGTASGLVGGAVVALPALPLKTTADAVIAAYLEYLRHLRFHDEDWIRRTMTRRASVPVPQQTILDVIADENIRQTEFERKAMLRVRRDTPKVFAKPEAERSAALTKLLGRERGYARFRAEAMAVRAFSAVDRVVLLTESPTGAFWRLDANVKEHTADCIAMGGQFWPWIVLKDFHPPTHAGCRCGLHSFTRAVAAGWMKPGDVMDVAVAIRKAAAAKALLHEAELDEWEELGAAILRTGLATPAQYQAAIAEVLR